jgi:uncharacterized protein
MLFAIFCVDKPDQGEARAANRPAHLEYLGGFKDKMFAAGPTQTDDGQAMNGSLLIMDLPDRAAAEAFAAGDPYRKAGIFESVVIRRWKKTQPAED